MNGVKTDKLELVAEGSRYARKIFPEGHRSGWILRVASVSSRSSTKEMASRASATYFNIKLNQSLPSDAFTFKTDRKTQYMNR